MIDLSKRDARSWLLPSFEVRASYIDPPAKATTHSAEPGLRAGKATNDPMASRLAWRAGTSLVTVNRIVSCLILAAVPALTVTGRLHFLNNASWHNRRCRTVEMVNPPPTVW